MRKGTMKGALSALLLVTTSISLTATAIVNVRVQVSTTHIVSVIDDLFVGVTLDAGLLARHWRGLDFKSQKVQTLAKGLSPCYLRIGGTAGDSLTFYPSVTGKVDLYRSFTGATWDAVNKFVQDVNWTFIFGLNALKRKEGKWDPTNAKELLKYTSAKGYQLAGLELGNEPIYFHGTYNKTVSGRQLGRDFGNFKNLLRSTPGYEKTLVIGPDLNPVPGKQFLADFLAGGGDRAVDRITFHQYYLISHPVQLSSFTDRKLMDTLVSTIHTGLDVTRRTNPRTPVWLGETSSCSHCEVPDITKGYVAGFLWLDKLGIASRMGLKAVFRQDFYANSYALIDNSFDPLPDYWLTLLYKRLVGNKVFDVPSSSHNIRLYAHCTKINNAYNYKPGSITVYALNLNDDAITLTISGLNGKSADAFWLTPEGGDLKLQKVRLNGKTLELVNNQIPHMTPRHLVNRQIIVPRHTFGFIVIPDANIAACHSQGQGTIIGVTFDRRLHTMTKEALYPNLK